MSEVYISHMISRVCIPYERKNEQIRQQNGKKRVGDLEYGKLRDQTLTRLYSRYNMMKCVSLYYKYY